jgi:Ca2+-binding EF-hand superfamily protein
VPALSVATGFTTAWDGDRVDTFFRFYGDSDGDRDVDFRDFARLLRAFGRSADDPRYLGAFDFDADGMVELVDLLAFVRRFGQRLEL